MKREGNGQRGVVWFLLAGCLLAGCSVPVASALDETDANEIVLRLERSNIDATKEIDPTAEGKFRILVARDDTPEAVEALHDERLPRVKPKGVLESTAQGALLPGPESEHAQLEAGRAGEFERTLLGIEGVIYARVHLSLPRKLAFGSEKESKATASVLVAQRGAQLSQEAVQRLVAGGVPNLAREDVQVVFLPQGPTAAKDRPRELAHVGPIAVAAGSRSLLQALLGGSLVLLMGLAAALLVLQSRALRKIRELEAPPKAR